LQLISRAAKLMKLKAFLKKREPHTYRATKISLVGASGLLYHTQGCKAGYLGDSPAKLRLPSCDFQLPTGFETVGLGVEHSIGDPNRQC
jgi:hypothetical protein